MGRNRHTSKSRNHRQDEQSRQYVVPPQLRDAYREFVKSVQEAEAAANAAAAITSTNPKDHLDLSGAAQLLGKYPVLSNYLKGIMQREEARKQAMGDTSGGVPFAVSYAVPGTEGFFPDYAAGKHGPPTGSHPQDTGALGGWTIGGPKSGKVPQGVANAATLRYLADTNSWVRAAINTRRQQIGRADIAVVPADERKRWNRDVLKRIQRLLDQPNELRDSYRTLIEPVLEDILVLDRGCISKNMTPQRQPAYLYYEDGATIKIYTDWDGSDKKPHYLYEDPSENGQRKVPLFNDELICISANPATYRLGLSPVQWLRTTIDAEMRAIRSAEHYVDMKPPPHIVQVPGAHQTQITNLRNNYDAEIAGRKELFWMGGDNAVQVHPLTSSARENQWLEWQQYLAKKIAVAFQLAPQQFGFTEDVNRSSGEIQQQIFEDSGLIPLLLLLEEYLNRELLMDFAPRYPDGRANLDAINLRIIYPEISEGERAIHAGRAAEIAQQSMAGLPSATINQILLMRGEEPVPGGNTYWVMTKDGPMPWLTYDKDFGDWNPLASLGGMLGAQDPFGGPDEDQDEEGAKGGTNKKPDNPSDAEQGQAQSAKTPKTPSTGKAPKKRPSAPQAPSQGDQSSASGLVEAPNFNASVNLPNRVGEQGTPTAKRYDVRKPGRHWSPTWFNRDYEETD